ncbi:MAG: indole-3-glycerol phosphate synthase TrpC [Vicinamibacterales bacterium]
MTSQAPPDLLATIVAATRRIVAVRSTEVPLKALERALSRRPDGDAFRRALSESPTPRIIAECKRRSPSRGILRQHYDAAAHARAYQDAGAAAVSVLTEPTFFDGDPSHLRAVRNAVTIPVLRKDFIVSGYQLYEAAAIGADAVLLIVGALNDHELRDLHHKAGTLGLECLVEVHDVAELARALDAGASIVGVNSRSLRTLSVDLKVLDTIGGLLPPDVIAVAESGIRTRDDIDRLTEAGYGAFLVGERLIGQPDPGEALRQLNGHP